MPKSFRQLVLCPEDPQWMSSVTEDACRAVGLIAEVIDEQTPSRFYIGDQFLQHVSFMGCAPDIEFTPDQDKELDWQQFTFVHLSSDSIEAHCFVDLDMAKPQCPACQKRIREPRLYLSKMGRQRCPHCQHEAELGEFNWREFGGCARTRVSIVNAYPKEAIPTDNLLQQLEKQTQVKWRYFYYYGPLINEH